MLCHLLFLMTIMTPDNTAALQKLSNTLEGIQDILEGECSRLKPCKSFNEVIEEKKKELEEMREYVNRMEEGLCNTGNNVIDRRDAQYRLLHFKYRLDEIKIRRDNYVKLFDNDIKSLFQEVQEVNSSLWENNNKVKDKQKITSNNQASENISSCPTGWKTFLNNCYKSSGTWRSWTKAEENCVQLGGHLASVHSQEEADYIIELSKDEILWIGGNDREEEGVYTNTDGTLVDYTNWAYGEPDDGKRDCAVIYNETLEWLPVNCEGHYPTVCKAPSAGKKCQNGWTALNSNCYKAIESHRSLNNASSVCRGLGGEVPSIHSQEENSLVVRISQGFYKWISLKRTENADYEWIDGSPLNFRAWDPGYPRMATSEDCIVMSTYADTDEYVWIDTYCEASRLPYVCKTSQKIV